MLTECPPVGTEQHFVLIYNCGADNKVKSEVLDQIASLERAGYESIIGLLDLYPRPLAALVDLETLEHACGLCVEVIAQVMEMEAWFIGEYRHFERWHPNLTCEWIAEALGIDIKSLDFESVPVPTKLLNKIYKLVGKKGYKKSKGVINKVVHCLDWEHFYVEVRCRSAAIERLLGRIDNFLT